MLEFERHDSRIYGLSYQVELYRLQTICSKEQSFLVNELIGMTSSLSVALQRTCRLGVELCAGSAHLMQACHGGMTVSQGFHSDSFLNESQTNETAIQLTFIMKPFLPPFHSLGIDVRVPRVEKETAATQKVHR